MVTDAGGRGAAAGVMVRKRPDNRSTEPEKCLLISAIVIQSPERPAAVVGMRLSEG